MTLRRGADLNIYNQIKEVARVLFRSQGFENTSVLELVEQSQIDEQTFFLYFQSTDELLEVLWSES